MRGILDILSALAQLSAKIVEFSENSFEELERIIEKENENNTQKKRND